MTELELAKIRLTEAQRALAIVRASQAGELSQRYAESHVLSALSWVWDAQERAANSWRITGLVGMGDGSFLMTGMPGGPHLMAPLGTPSSFSGPSRIGAGSGS